MSANLRHELEEDFPPIIDYTDSFNHYGHSMETVAAHGRGQQFLTLMRLPETIQRFDGKFGKYVLEFRDLSKPCRYPLDQSWACVLNDDRNIYQYKEIRTVLEHVKNGKTLFELFDLF